MSGTAETEWYPLPEVTEDCQENAKHTYHRAVPYTSTQCLSRAPLSGATSKGTSISTSHPVSNRNFPYASSVNKPPHSSNTKDHYQEYGEKTAPIDTSTSHSIPPNSTSPLSKNDLNSIQQRAVLLLSGGDSREGNHHTDLSNTTTHPPSITTKRCLTTSSKNVCFNTFTATPSPLLTVHSHPPPPPPSSSFSAQGSNSTKRTQTNNSPPPTQHNLPSPYNSPSSPTPMHDLSMESIATTLPPSPPQPTTKHLQFLETPDSLPNEPAPPISIPAHSTNIPPQPPSLPAHVQHTTLTSQELEKLWKEFLKLSLAGQKSLAVTTPQPNIRTPIFDFSSASERESLQSSLSKYSRSTTCGSDVQDTPVHMSYGVQPHPVPPPASIAQLNPAQPHPFPTSNHLNRNPAQPHPPSTSVHPTYPIAFSIAHYTHSNHTNTHKQVKQKAPVTQHLSQLTLQEALRVFRPDFIQHSESRLHTLRKKRRLRTYPTRSVLLDNRPHRSEVGGKHITVAVENSPRTSQFFYADVINSRPKMSSQQMYRRSKKYWYNLPEVKQKETEQKRRLEMATNRLRMKLYEQEVLGRLRQNRK